MRRFTAIEKSAIALGLLFVVFGACMLIHPMETNALHLGMNGFTWRTAQLEHVSKRGSKIYGGIAIVLGGGIISLACYRGKN